MQTRREATREATIREIKQTALARMRAQGTVDVRLSDVARDMRMSAPGLYRYFDGREGLLAALVTDSLTELAERVEAARDSVPAGDAGGRFLAVARAYREWALSDPQGFTLVFGPPLVGVARGHQADGDGPGKAAAIRAMEGLRSLVREAEEAGTRQSPPMELPPVLAEAFADKALHGADPATELALCHTWAALHGFVTLEAYGNLGWHGPQVRESIFLGLVRMLIEEMGLPEPADGWPAETPRPAVSGRPTGAAAAAGRASAGSSPAPGR
jgi:AcrR family transcriptional regulator